MVLQPGYTPDLLVIIENKKKKNGWAQQEGSELRGVTWYNLEV